MAIVNYSCADLMRNVNPDVNFSEIDAGPLSDLIKL